MLTAMPLPLPHKTVCLGCCELPSQFLENWCYEKEALAFISGHYESGEPLPQELLSKLLAKNYQSAEMSASSSFRYLIFIFTPITTPLRAVKFKSHTGVRQQVAVIQPPSFNRFQHGFAYIFAGGYSAGYYSYKWAEVLSADAFLNLKKRAFLQRYRPCL